MSPIYVLLFISMWQVISGNRGYLVVSPNVFRPGMEEVLSVTILHPSVPIHVEAKLYSKTGKLLTHAGHEIFGKGTLNLEVPSHAKGRATLKICGNCISPKEGTFTFYNSSQIYIDQKSTSVFIYTDRPIYKPNQRVMINFMITTPSLRPASEKLSAYIVDPKGSKMIQWDNLKPLCCGIINTTFPISDQPVLGKWSVFAEVQGQLYNASFEIQKYVLPKFDVAIEPPPYLEDWSECRPVYVRARYTYDKEVVGNMTATASVQGVGYYKDYNSQTSVTSMRIQGVAAFNVCVHHLIKTEVPEHFRGVLTISVVVTTPDGATGKASDTSCPVNKQLIDLEFSKDTRRHFKPGLPFRGKVYVYHPDGSKADNVTVRVRTTVNTGMFTAQELVSEKGMVSFEVPALPVMAQAIWIDAKVIQIRGHEVSQHYFPSYLSILPWYSPSSCHIMIEGKTAAIKVGRDAKFRILSTCPCNFTMFHEVVSKGNIVLSGIHFARHFVKRSTEESAETAKDQIVLEEAEQEEEEQPGGGVTTCTTYLKFQVTHAMMPFGRLVVYYVKESGETVADSLLFTVQPSYENKVTVVPSKRQTLPGDSVNIRVSTKPDSCVCVAAVDKSVYLLKPNWKISTQQVFDELENYDVTVAQDYDDFWFSRPAGRLRRRRRRRRSTSSNQLRSKDAQFAFEEAGLLVMTDRAYLNYHQDPGPFSGPVFQHPSTGYLPVQALSTGHQGSRNYRKRKRTFFPETWIWSCFNVSSSRKHHNFQVTVPDSITSWMVEGFSLSKKYGLALADPVSVRTFKKFFLDFNLPYSVIRGEQVRIPITVYNYYDTCVAVNLTVSVPNGVQFSRSGERSEQYKLCIGSRETRTLSAVLLFSQLGDVDITAEAVAYTDGRCCSGFLKHLPKNREPVAHDLMVKPILSEAEGLPVNYAHSVFFCPNERIHISTPNKYEFQYLKKPEKVTTFTFAAKAKNDVRVALAKGPKDVTYELVLGGLSNTKSWISEGKGGTKLVEEDTKGIVTMDEFRSFWISWEGGYIKVGLGEEISNLTVLLSVNTNRALVAKYIGFSTGWGSKGEFKIWRKDETDGSYGEYFDLGIPPNHVPGSERAVAKIIGDVMGPTLSNLQQLLRLPYGCGEQNIIHFAPSVFVMKYFKKTGQITEDIRNKAMEYLLLGYQRQLTYKRDDGSYSAFGDRDSTGSMWLTAFVLKSFSQAKTFIFVDEKELSSAREWIISHQRKDGSFPQLGRLINKDIQGGLYGRVSLTAYVLTALLESGSNEKAEKLAITSARKYLEGKAHIMTNPYVAALTAYALTLLKSDHARTVVRKLNEMAIKRDGLTYWNLNSQNLQDQILLGNNENLEWSSASAEIEMTSYALLTFTASGDVAAALPIVKWLSQQRNSLGGFSSTQDTCVALQALSEYAILAFSGHVNLTVSLASTNLDLQEKFVLDSENSEILQSVQIPSIPTSLFVIAQGEGCALLQIDVSYNVPNPSSKPAFKLDVKMGQQTSGRSRSRRSKDDSGNDTNESDIANGSTIVDTNNTLDANDTDSESHNRSRRSIEDIDHNDTENEVMGDFKVTIETCARWLHAGSSNMAVIEVSLLTGFTADEESLDKLLKHKHLKLKRYEVIGRKVLFYFDEIPNRCLTCVSFEAYRKYVVGRTHPVSVRVFDYYEPAYESTVFYNVSRVSVLAQDLCDGSSDSCNEIQEDVELPEQNENCNSIFGCYEGAEEVERCSCYRDCHHAGSRVCGSDGSIYPNPCRMEVSACEMETHIEAMPMEFCVPDIESSGEESGGNMDDVISGDEELQTNVSALISNSVINNETINSATNSSTVLETTASPLDSVQTTVKNQSPDIDSQMMGTQEETFNYEYYYYDTENPNVYNPLPRSGDVDVPGAYHVSGREPHVLQQPDTLPGYPVEADGYETYVHASEDTGSPGAEQGVRDDGYFVVPRERAPEPGMKYVGPPRLIHIAKPVSHVQSYHESQPYHQTDSAGTTDVHETRDSSHAIEGQGSTSSTDGLTSPITVNEDDDSTVEDTQITNKQDQEEDMGVGFQNLDILETHENLNQSEKSSEVKATEQEIEETGEVLHTPEPDVVTPGPARHINNTNSREILRELAQNVSIGSSDAGDSNEDDIVTPDDIRKNISVEREKLKHEVMQATGEELHENPNRNRTSNQVSPQVSTNATMEDFLKSVMELPDREDVTTSEPDRQENSTESANTSPKTMSETAEPKEQSMDISKSSENPDNTLREKTGIKVKNPGEHPPLDNDPGGETLKDSELSHNESSNTSVERR